jgi:hypothetical protein
VREERRAERFPSDRFSAPPPPLTQNSRFSKAIEADEDYVRPEDRNRGPAKSRFDEEEEFRGPPPVVQNSRFAAAAAEMEVEREAENREREERRAMRGPPRDMDGPPPMPTNSRFAAAAASHEVDKEKEFQEREDRRAERQRQYEDRGGQGDGDDRGGQSSRFGDDRGGQPSSRFGDNRGGNSRFGDDRGGNSRFGDDRGGNSRFGDDRGGGRFGGRMNRGQGDAFPSSMKDRSTTTFVKPVLPSHLQPKKAEEPVLPVVEAPLTLPGEDEEAAKARIEKKRREEEEKKLAEQKAAEDAAAQIRAEEEAAAEEAKKAAAVEGDLLNEFIGGKSGVELKEWCASQGAILPSIEKLVYHLLVKTQSDDPDVDCAWADQANYGAALTSLVDDNLSAMMEILFAIQRFCDKIGFPKIGSEGLIQAMFRSMYKFDLADEEAFAEWKDDEKPEREQGKGKAIIQTMDWFNWLEEESDDESEEESDDEEE